VNMVVESVKDEAGCRWVGEVTLYGPNHGVGTGELVQQIRERAEASRVEQALAA
jgi:hypothetical protein